MQIEPQPIWGNYMLKEIEESFIPDSVSLFPETVGWLWVLGFIILIAGIQGLKAWKHWKRNYYRRWAIAQIKQLQQNVSNQANVISKLPLLLKVTAINAYGRETTASLSGNQWLEFLDQSISESKENTRFNSALGELLLKVSYQPETNWHIDSDKTARLLILADNWIRNHKEEVSHA